MDITITIPNDKIELVASSYGIFIADYETNAEAIISFKEALLNSIKRRCIKYKRKVLINSSSINADEITME